MADYVFKVQVFLSGKNIETVILRQYIDPVDRCFDRFKSNLIQRYDSLTSTPFKMNWIDNDGDKISIFNEEDLRTFMELKGTKIFFEVDGNSNNSPSNAEPKPVPEQTRCTNPNLAPLFRSCRRAERGWIPGSGRYQAQNVHDSMNGNNNNANAGSSSTQTPLHAGVRCDGCECEIRGYRYKCIECPDFDLCFSCEMKKMHGDHMMIRIVKPLDRPLNRHFLKAMMKQRCLFRDSCESKDKDKRRHRYHDNAVVVDFDDIMTDIAKNISTHCTTQPKEASNADTNRGDKANQPIDLKQKFALNSETFAKAGEVLSNLAQHFVNVMDPFAVHEFIPTTQTTVNPNVDKNDAYQNETATANEPTKVADDESHDKNANDLASSTSTPPSNASNAPIPAESLVTIEDVIEAPSAAPLPNYAVLARDLEDHLQYTLKSQASQTPTPMPIVHHPNPKINEAIITMTSMGFSNGGGWLTRLLENVNGDIPKALEKLHPSQ